MFVLLSVAHVIAIHDYVLDDHELQGMAGGRSLEGAIARVDNRLAYGVIDDIFALAEAYTAAISKAHCFNDGNKRTAFQVLDLVLGLNVVQAEWDVEEVGQQIILLARSKLDELVFADSLRAQVNGEQHG